MSNILPPKGPIDGLHSLKIPQIMFFVVVLVPWGITQRLFKRSPNKFLQPRRPMGYAKPARLPPWLMCTAWYSNQLINHQMWSCNRLRQLWNHMKYLLQSLAVCYPSRKTLGLISNTLYIHSTIPQIENPHHTQSDINFIKTVDEYNPNQHVTLCWTNEVRLRSSWGDTLLISKSGWWPGALDRAWWELH